MIFWIGEGMILERLEWYFEPEIAEQLYAEMVGLT